jgi:hypothetical protein
VESWRESDGAVRAVCRSQDQEEHRAWSRSSAGESCAGIRFTGQAVHLRDLCVVAWWRSCTSYVLLGRRFCTSYVSSVPACEVVKPRHVSAFSW